MSGDVRVWGLIAGLAVIAFFSRAIFVVPGSRLSLPPTLERVLRFAPAAALVAIIVPDLFRLGGVVTLSFDNPRVVAGVVAIIVAAWTRNILLTIVSGMLVLWLAGRLMNV